MFESLHIKYNLYIQNSNIWYHCQCLNLRLGFFYFSNISFCREDLDHCLRQWSVMSPSTGLVVRLFFTRDWLIDGCEGSSLLVGYLVVGGGWGGGQRGRSSSQCTGFSLAWILLLQSTSPGGWSFSSSAFLLSCSAECGSFLALALRPYPLHRQADP